MRLQIRYNPARAAVKSGLCQTKSQIKKTQTAPESAFQTACNPSGRLKKNRQARKGANMKTTRLNTLAACLGLLFCVPELWHTSLPRPPKAAPSMP